MKYLCIHGHFYQPPRENAWTGTVEVQESAAPYHDWNARITAECYGPNASSRVLNGDKFLTALVDNYSLMSFNFGPTLLSWLEDNAPHVYNQIIESDKISQKNFSGHGSAIAQVYNHMIMPLANARDKQTQVIWGIEDFKKRFGRYPEGMWLAETACDVATLEVLAEHDIKFTILAPGQCARTRKIGTKDWTETPNASVDPKKPYLCNLPSGKKIVLFFYDGPISQGIAFSDTLKSGENFAARLLGAYTPAANSSDELVHIATDGETYGHHQKFADMALAYCLKYMSDNKLAKITIYGEYLDKVPPTYEAQIYDNTSWSCFHGVERWRSDCGCNSGMHQGWNQKWRGPLRDALDLVREGCIKTFETLGKEYLKDPWAARDNYISAVLDRSEENVQKFLSENATEKGLAEKEKTLELLETQHHCMLMYTSCGWFFDEISGIETVQIMQYAARAIELNAKLTGVSLESDFISKLLLAPSNVQGFGNGANIYERLVKPMSFSVEKIAAHYALALTYNNDAKEDFLSYRVTETQQEVIEGDNAKTLIGSAVFTSKFTLESKKVYFALFYSLDSRTVCFSGSEKNIEKEELKKIILASNAEKTLEEMAKILPNSYTLSDLFKDTQKMVVKKILANIHASTEKIFDEVFSSQYPLLRELKYIGAPLPPAFTYAATFVLSEDLKQEVSAGEVDGARIEELLEDASSLGVQLNYEKIKDIAQKRLQEMCQIFNGEPSRDNAMTITQFLNVLEAMPFKPDVFYGQENVFLGLKKLSKTIREEPAFKVLARKMKVTA